MAVINSDVTIVGAGIAGQTLALALAQQDFSVVVIDANRVEQPLTDSFSARVSALSKASEQIFKNLGVWPHIRRAQPYTGMQVWEDQAFGKIAFSAIESNLDNLGHIVENSCITNALFEAGQSQRSLQVLQQQKIMSVNKGEGQHFVNLDNGDMLASKLIVGADGGASFVRKIAEFATTFWDYDHIAIVANVRTENAHDLIARQAFTPTGPLAFLPMSEANTCSIVWSQDTDEALRLLELSDAEFCKALQVAIDNQLGHCELLTQRYSYPLKMQYAQQWLSDGIVLVGDAAHTIHPLAGQGANLGLLDVASLVEVLVDARAKGADIHSAKSLRAYERWRKTEALKVVATMEGFKRLFSGNFAPVKLARNLGLAGANNLQPVKKFFIQQATGSAGKLPKLAK
ncbi:FAD-dependent monooxygenase [Glaciecola sp. MH2013]|uniref:FAD-dependent monooxygenase n=1 Tax=Glaciecola sp. MH2013 TaxID=2785524 RepID=UPI00189F2446|nr:FAD-dependent monooxygenase [Glaciecola sp. MH2013]MBF7072084.1 FAD-dependent monooxygenase [Glaciecola sp. MH2013]